MQDNDNELALLSVLKEDASKRYNTYYKTKKHKKPDDPESFKDVPIPGSISRHSEQTRTHAQTMALPRINFDEYEAEFFLEDDCRPRTKPVYLGDDAPGKEGNYEVGAAETVNERQPSYNEYLPPYQQERRLFIYDERTQMYHSSTGLCCRLMGFDKSKGLQFLETDVKTCICPLCLPTINANKSYQSKDKLVQRVLKAYCEQQDMFIEFVGSIAYVSTIAGEWYFDYTIKEPALHHRSTEQREVAPGKVSHYHIQRINTKTALTAVMYIYRHDQATIRRLMGSEIKCCEEQTLPALVHRLCVDAGIEIDDLLEALGITRKEWALWVSEDMLTVQIETISFIADFFEIDSGEFISHILRFTKGGARNGQAANTNTAYERSGSQFYP